MPSPSHLKTIAIVGASGNIGAATLNHLLESPANFAITIITRSDSSSTFPSSSSITIKKGSYDDPSFLHSAFQGQDAVVFAVGFMAMGEQDKLIEAAVKAGVEWILPTEYAGDTLNESVVASVPLFQPKVDARKLVESVDSGKGRSKWIGIATNPWLEYCLQSGMFSIDISSRKATLYEGSGRFNTSTIAQAGKGIANLLSLPVTNQSNPRASLEYYANNFAYISSCHVTQRELFDTVLRATDTSEAEWTVETDTIHHKIEVGREALAKGDFMGSAIGLVFGMYMGEGMGGDYENKSRVDREVLGLEEEDLEEIVKRVVADAS